MAKGLTAVSWSFFFHGAEDSITRGHSWKLVKNHCRCNIRLVKLSIYGSRWNCLSEGLLKNP